MSSFGRTLSPKAQQPGVVCWRELSDFRAWGTASWRPGTAAGAAYQLLLTAAWAHSRQQQLRLHSVKANEDSVRLQEMQIWEGGLFDLCRPIRSRSASPACSQTRQMSLGAGPRELRAMIGYLLLHQDGANSSELLETSRGG